MSEQVIAWFGPIVAALLTCAGQLWLNQKFKRADATYQATWTIYAR